MSVLRPVLRLGIIATCILCVTGCVSKTSRYELSFVVDVPEQTGQSIVAPQFSGYMSRLTSKVGTVWRGNLMQMGIQPPHDSTVTITFTLDSEGLVRRIDEVEENAGKQATYACLAAIEGSQPYRPWSEEMIGALGNEQMLTFTFQYR